MPSIHHVAITVSDLEKSLGFYQKLGFKILFSKDTPEKGKRLVLLAKEELKLEMFWYVDAKDNPSSRDTIGNNVKEVGQKHFALLVESVADAQNELQSLGILLASDPDVGDAGYKFFFIRDPDGIWIEYVQDDRY